MLLSTMISLPCEASTEAQTSDLELTRVSVDRFTVETTNLAVRRSLIGSVAQGCLNPSINILFQKRLSSHTHIGVRDFLILRSLMPRLRAHVRSSAGPPPAPSLVWACSASYSARC